MHISLFYRSLSLFEGATETRLPYFLFAVLPIPPPPLAPLLISQYAYKILKDATSDSLKAHVCCEDGVT